MSSGVAEHACSDLLRAFPEVSFVPRVSIGLPVYNGAPFVERSLQALLAQTYEDFELVISDNGSTDGTEEICRTAADADARVRYVRQEHNRGAAWNFSNLVRVTSGPYFRWATHDDLVAPTNLERCVEVLDQSPDGVALVYPRTQLIDEHGDALRDYDDNLDLRQKTPHERLRALVQNLVLSNACYGLIRRSVLERTRLLDSFPSSDYVLMAELAMLGQFREIPDRLFFRRMHASMSREANATPDQVAAWFDPAASSHRRREFTRLFLEHVRSIATLPLGTAERARCFTTFLDVWLRRNGVHVIDELFGLEYVPDSPVRFRRRRGR